MKWYSPSQVLTAKHVSYPQLTATVAMSMIRQYVTGLTVLSYVYGVTVCGHVYGMMVRDYVYGVNGM